SISPRAIRACLLGVITLFMIGGCSTVPMTGRNRVLIMNETQLAALSATQYKEVLSREKISEDPTGTGMLQRASLRLVQATEVLAKDYGFSQDLSAYQWEFTLIEDQAVNAFC